MKNKKYLPLYYKWCKKGIMPCEGLCLIFEDDEIFNIIDPEDGKMETYWGCDDPEKGPDHRCDTSRVFGPLRQTIVLLMAAMNGEL